MRLLAASVLFLTVGLTSLTGLSAEAGGGDQVDDGAGLAQALTTEEGAGVTADVPGSGGSGGEDGPGGSQYTSAADRAAAAEAARLAERCRQMRATDQSVICQLNVEPGPNAAGAAPAPIDPGVAARAAVARLPIPAPVANVGPPPHINEWNMVAVGYPLWFWTDGPDEHTTTVTEQGITITLTARRTSTGFDFGDGNRKWCAYTRPWTKSVQPGAPSPSCGYVYEQPSLPKGTYAVTATTVWTIHWSALGQSGDLPFQRTGPPTQLPVGELHAVRTR